MLGCQQVSLASGLGSIGPSNCISHAMMPPLHHVRTTQLRSLRSNPVLRIGLYRVPGVQITARSHTEQQNYPQPSSTTETSVLAKITARVLISIPIAAAILGLTPRKVYSATATADFTLANGARQAAVMDHRTGMPHKWVYSNDNQWSHHEYDAIYRFYTEGLPPQQPSPSSQVPAMTSSASAASSENAVKKETSAEIRKVASNQAEVAVQEKSKDVKIELKEVTQPGKVAAMVDALNRKSSSFKKQLQQQQKEFSNSAQAHAKNVAQMMKQQEKAIMDAVKQQPTLSINQNTTPSAASSSTETEFSILTSANTFRIAVGQSILSQVQEMRNFATSTASQAAGKVKELLPTQNKQEQQEQTASMAVAEKNSVADLKRGISTLAGRGASAIVNGANSIANTASHGASVVVNSANAAATSAADSVRRGGGAVASGATTAATVASQQAADLLSKAESFSNTLGSAVLSQAAEFKKVASNTMLTTSKAVNGAINNTGAATSASAAVAPSKSVDKTQNANGSMNAQAGLNAAIAAAASAPKYVIDGATSAASTASQQAAVLLGKADGFKNTIGGAVVNQTSNLKRAAGEALVNTKKAISSMPVSSSGSPSTNVAAAAAAVADKKLKKDAKPVAVTAVSKSASAAKPAAKATTQSSKKQQTHVPQQTAQQQQKESQGQTQSIELLAKAQAFRQTLGHAVLSQMTAFKQAAVNAKMALPSLPTRSAPATTTASSQKQSKAATPKVKKPTKSVPTKTTSAKIDTKKGKNSPSPPTSTSPMSASLDKVTLLTQSLSKDVIVMKDAILSAFVWQPATLTLPGNVQSTAKNSVSSGATTSPAWGWAPTAVHTSTSPAAAGAAKGKVVSSPEKTSWFAGTGNGVSSVWGWAPTTVHPLSNTRSNSGGGGGSNGSSVPGKGKSSKSSSTSSSSSAIATAPVWGWNPSTYFPSSPSSSSAAASAGQWSWAPTSFFPSSPSSPIPGSSNPQWSWNPTTFSTTPRIAFIAAGLIGCAYILGVAWHRATTLHGEAIEGLDTERIGEEDSNITVSNTSTNSFSNNSSSGGNGNGGVGDAQLLRTAAATGTVVTLSDSDGYNSTVDSGNSNGFFSSDSYDGNFVVSDENESSFAVNSAAAAAAASGRSREELIAESQRRIDAAKEAVAKAEKQKTEAAAAAAAAEERVRMQEEAVAAAAAAARKAELASNSSSPSSFFSSQFSSQSSPTPTTEKEKSIADSFCMVRSLVHSAALVDDWGTPVTSKYDPLESTIGTITSSQWELSDWATGPNKYDPLTTLVQDITTSVPISGTFSKYDPITSGVKNMTPWTGPARDRTKTPLREEKYDMVAALFTAIMTQQEPPLRKNAKIKNNSVSVAGAEREDLSWDPVAVALDAAAGWQPPQPRSFTTSPTGEIVISEADKYDLTASLMAGLYQITPPRMSDGGAQWDPLKFILTGWAAEWQGTSADVRRPVSPTYDPAAGMKGAEPSKVRSKYDWAQAVLHSEAPTSTFGTSDSRTHENNGTISDSSGGGGKRAWLVRASSSLKENVPKMLKWKGKQDAVEGGDGGSGSSAGATAAVENAAIPNEIHFRQS